MLSTNSTAALRELVRALPGSRTCHNSPYPDFLAMGAEVLGGQGTCSKLHGQYVAEQDSEPGPKPRLCLLPLQEETSPRGECSPGGGVLGSRPGVCAALRQQG